MTLALVLTLAALDLSRASIALTPSPSALERKAAQVLQEEIEKRTQVLLPIGGGERAPVIALRVQPNPAKPEGYTIATNAGGVTITGNDGRGVLFGAGHLLRKLECERGSAILPRDLTVTTAPETKLRGHQLGYRHTANSYDGWDEKQFEQYIRELAAWRKSATAA